MQNRFLFDCPKIVKSEQRQRGEEGDDDGGGAGGAVAGVGAVATVFGPEQSGIVRFFIYLVVAVFLFPAMRPSPARAILNVYVVCPRTVYAVPLVPPYPGLTKPSARADVTPVAVHWRKQISNK